MHIDLLEYTHAQNRENGVNAGFKSQPTLYDFKKCVHRDGAPDLYFHRVGFASVKGLDAHVHFEPLEEQLNVPACFIEQSDSEGRQLEVVGEKHQEIPGFRFAKNDPTEPGRVVELGARDGEADDLISDDTFAMRRERMATKELQVRFGTGNEVSTCLVDAPETSEVDIAAVEQIKAPGFKLDRIEPVDIVNFSIGNVHQNRQGPTQIELGVDLDRRFVFPETGPRENSQAKIDCGRIDRVDCRLEIVDTAGFISAKLARSRDEQQRQILEDPVVAGCVGVSDCAACNRTSKPEVIKLLLARSQAVLQIAKTLSKREQREGQCEQMVPRGKSGGLIVTAVFCNDPSEIPFRKEVDDLRENEASRMHGNRLYAKAAPKRPKSADSINAFKITTYEIKKSVKLKSRQAF